MDNEVSPFNCVADWLSQQAVHAEIGDYIASSQRPLYAQCANVGSVMIPCNFRDVIHYRNTSSVSHLLKTSARMLVSKLGMENETKTEMTMIHAVECGTITVMSLQRRIPY